MDATAGFKTEKIDLPNDKYGKVEATLISKNAEAKSDKAVLYIHGFVDYFFQYHMADHLVKNGWNFYAIDLRKYGRSMMQHHKPNMINDLRDYFEEINKAIELIRSRDKNEKLIMIGHSTGGLIGSLYAHYTNQEEKIDGLILNSPFFEFNKPDWYIKYIIPQVARLGLRFPNLPSPEGLKEGYVKSIHKNFNGEWEFDLTMKPVRGFKINFGWIAAIYYAQRNLQSGLNIDCPVLVLHSSKSFTPGNFKPEMMESDSVLNVKHIKKFSKGIGNDVKVVEIKNGVHDLVLSKPSPRGKTMAAIDNFLDSLSS